MRCVVNNFIFNLEKYGVMIGKQFIQVGRQDCQMGEYSKIII